MNPRNLIRSVIGMLPISVAVAVALAVLADIRGHGVLGIIAAIGTACEVVALPLLSAVHGPKEVSAIQLPRYRQPLPVPTGRGSQAIAGTIVLIMVLVMLWLPGGVAFVLMLIAGLGLIANLAMAYRARRGRSRHRAALRQAIDAYQPRFVIYTGRRNDASYQLTMWIPILERLGLPYLVALRYPEAVRSTKAVTTAPIVVLPTGSDLDAITVPSLQVAFYVNGTAENASFVNYRTLKHVYLGHGDSDKELSVHPMHSMFDRVFVAGQAAIDRYDQAGVIIPRDKFVIVGRPQMARLQQAARTIGEVERTTVLYAPTWRGYNAQTTLSSLPVGAKIVSGLLERGAVVHFRAHPFSWLGARERSEIVAIDDLLRKDRDSSGRPHRLAAEGRDATVAEAFDASDALITDVGSVLVDYFATGKPYAVVLPRGQAMETARADLPSTEAAYLIDYASVAEQGGSGSAEAMQDLMQNDPLADRRDVVRRHYLGDRPGDDGPFLEQVRVLIGETADNPPPDQDARPT